LDGTGAIVAQPVASLLGVRSRAIQAADQFIDRATRGFTAFKVRASPGISNLRAQGSGLHVFHGASELRDQNEANVVNMKELIDSDGWNLVVVTDGPNPISVWSKKLPPGSHVASDDANDVAAAKHACIKATAVIKAPPREVFKLFLDNSRVSEYNEHCNDLEDLEHLSPDTKISWSVTTPFGPFKARDFVTMVHYREERSTGVLMAVNRPASHPDKPLNSVFQRGEVLLAGNVMEPVAGDPSSTKLTLITHINPGGIVDNAVGAVIMNKLTATSPVEFIKKLEVASQK